MLRERDSERFGGTESESISGPINNRISRAEPVQTKGELAIERESSFEERPRVGSSIFEAKRKIDGMGNEVRRRTVEESEP
jgi:hypothetical protein